MISSTVPLFIRSPSLLIVFDWKEEMFFGKWLQGRESFGGAGFLLVQREREGHCHWKMSQ